MDFGLDEIQHPLLGSSQVLHRLHIWIVVWKRFVNLPPRRASLVDLLRWSGADSRRRLPPIGRSRGRQSALTSPAPHVRNPIPAPTHVGGYPPSAVAADVSPR
jgi:hypothetical protein